MSDGVVKIILVFLVDLLRCRLTCGASIGKQSWNDSKPCEFRNTTEILREKAVVYNCFVNLIKDVHTEEQVLKCQNVQWFSNDMDAAYFRTQSTGCGLSSPAGFSCSTWKITLILVFYAAAQWIFGLGPSFLLTTSILWVTFSYFCQTIVLEDFPCQMQKEEYKHFPVCPET